MYLTVDWLSSTGFDKAYQKSDFVLAVIGSSPLFATVNDAGTSSPYGVVKNASPGFTAATGTPMTSAVTGTSAVVASE